MLNFHTSQTGEAAVDAYMEHLEEERKEEERLWAEAMEEELYKEDPILFIKMFGVDAYKNIIDKKGLKVSVVPKSQEEQEAYNQKKAREQEVRDSYNNAQDDDNDDNDKEDYEPIEVPF